MTDWTAHDYPTEAQLHAIEDWPHEDGWHALLERVSSIWWGGGEFYATRHGDDHWCISTVGWSGNEDIIDALKKNYIFWMFCWESSRRGGHYIFKVPAP